MTVHDSTTQMRYHALTMIFSTYLCAPRVRRLIALLSLLSVLPLNLNAQTTNHLIKGSGPAIYFYSAENKRYVFPNAAMFKTWYPGNPKIVQLSDESLASIFLGGNVLFRPGSTLVKITTDPRVYAVSRYGVLRWITSEALAQALYGQDWNKQVLDVPDVYFTNYLIGSPIFAFDAYQVTAELASATMPQDNLRPIGYVAPNVTTSTSSETPPTYSTPSVNAPTVDIVLGVSQAALNQSVAMFVTVIDSKLPIARIDIRSEGSSDILATCLMTNTCSATFTVSRAPFTDRYYAEATDGNGAKFKTADNKRPTLSVAAVSDQIQISITPQTISVGSRVSFSSDATKFYAITSHKIFALIPGEPIPVPWQDCGAINLCATSAPFYRTTHLYSQITVGGQTFISAPVTVTVLGGEAPKPRLEITSRPAPNTLSITLTAPFGEKIGLTTLVDGTSLEDHAIALCEATCLIVVKVNTLGNLTAFTLVGGKYEKSNTLSVKPE